MDLVSASLLEARTALDALLGDAVTLGRIAEGGRRIAACIREGGRVFSCGNGGSMCDAMHFAEELTGRFRGNRRALPALAISDPAHLSCTANDFGYDEVFARYLEAHARRGDCLVALSTSGDSPNIVRAAAAAKEQGLTVIGLTGRAGSAVERLADVAICTPGGRYSDRVQELHIKVLHIFVEIVERELGL